MKSEVKLFPRWRRILGVTATKKSLPRANTSERILEIAKLSAQKLGNVSAYIACATLNQPHSAYALYYRF